MRDVLLDAAAEQAASSRSSEIGGARAFSARDDARSITGAILAIDGGWTAHGSGTGCARRVL